MAGYTRQDTANNIANGNVIDADDFDAEYNALEGAFNASTGHKHDGTAGEGAPITKVGPSQDLVVSATDVQPKTTNTLDLGTSGVQFKDGFFDGTLNADAITVGENGYLSLADNEIDVSSGDLTLDVAGNLIVDAEGDITLDANGGDILLKDDGTTFGVISNSSGQTVIKSGSTPTTAITLSGANATLAGNATVSGTLDVTGAVNFNNTTPSTSNTTGAVIVDGGMGIAGAVNIGSDVDIDGNLTVTGSSKNITGNLIGDVKSTNGTSVLDSGTDGTNASFTGSVTGNASTASAWQTGRSFSLTGDVAGSVTGVDGSGNVSIATTIQANSVALGADTTGNYVSSLVAGTGVTLTDNSGESATPTVAIGQAVATDSDVTFNNVTVDGNLTVGGTTTTINSTTITVDDPIFTLGGDTAPAADDNKDRGIEFRWHNGSDAKIGFFGFDDSVEKFTFIPDATNTSEVFSGTAGTIVASIEGNVTGDVLAADGTKILENGTDGTDAAFTGTVSSISNHDTDSLSEGGTNQYFTTARARSSVSAGNGISYDSSTGVISTNASDSIGTTDLEVSSSIKLTEGTSDWVFEVDASNNLVIKYGTTTVLKLTTAGELTVADDVTAFGTL